MKITVISLLPDMFDALDHGVTGKALKQKQVDLTLINPRQFSLNKYRQVDDRPYGGGPGMVMMAQPLGDAISAAKSLHSDTARTIYLSPQGKRINQQRLIDVVDKKIDLILVAGRYEGIDERIIDTVIDEEWSIGDIVLSGGELAAMTIIDSIARLLPGVLGNDSSAYHDSFMQGLLDHPHYTRPDSYQGHEVPPVLRQGNHHDIDRWRMKQSLGITWLKRPDLLQEIQLTDEQQQLLNDFKREHRQSNQLAQK